MRATRPLISALAAAAVCLVPAACGDGGDDRRTEPAPNAGTSSGLGPERFEALEDVYVAALPIDELEDDEDVDPRAFAAAARAAIAACEALAEDDPLLAAIRRQCPVVNEFTEQLLRIDRCEAETGDACLAPIEDARASVRRFERLGRRADRVIARSQLTPACRRALTTPELAYDVYDAFERALALLERGLRRGALDDVEEAERILTATDAKAQQLPDARASLERFRRGCA